MPPGVAGFRRRRFNLVAESIGSFTTCQFLPSSDET
jgi:hypothetical protein